MKEELNNLNNYNNNRLFKILLFYSIPFIISNILFIIFFNPKYLSISIISSLITLIFNSYVCITISNILLTIILILFNLNFNTFNSNTFDTFNTFNIYSNSNTYNIDYNNYRDILVVAVYVVFGLNYSIVYGYGHRLLLSDEYSVWVSAYFFRLEVLSYFIGFMVEKYGYGYCMMMVNFAIAMSNMVMYIAILCNTNLSNTNGNVDNTNLSNTNGNIIDSSNDIMIAEPVVDIINNINLNNIDNIDNNLDNLNINNLDNLNINNISNILGSKIYTTLKLYFSDNPSLIKAEYIKILNTVHNTHNPNLVGLFMSWRNVYMVLVLVILRKRWYLKNIIFIVTILSNLSNLTNFNNINSISNTSILSNSNISNLSILNRLGNIIVVVGSILKLDVLVVVASVFSNWNMGIGIGMGSGSGVSWRKEVVVMAVVARLMIVWVVYNLLNDVI